MAVKKLLLCIALIAAMHTTFAQYVTIPDPQFRYWLSINGFNACMSGNQLDTTCSLVLSTKTIVCWNKSISDLNGIQYFDSLTSLDCAYNLIYNLPPLPKGLITLSCNSNNISNLYNLPDSLQTLQVSSNNLTSLPTLPLKLTDLDCRGNQLTSINQLPSSLTKLQCGSNVLTSLSSLPASLTSLDCAYNNLSALPLLPASIKTLYCSNNNLGSLPALPSSLTNLTCNYNALASLPSLPTNLKYLSCYYNSLTMLPALPDSLLQLDCSYNQLSALPALNDSLRTIYCDNNVLNALPALPPKLTNLYCNNNLLVNLPPLSSSLITVNCSFNQLINLPSLSSSLNSLDCSFNQIDSLPQFNTNLQGLDCSHNNITVIPPINNKLNALDCSKNLLNTLPLMPPSVKYIYCDSNQITSITQLPDTLNQLSVKGNTGLHCLPAIRNIQTFYWSAGQFTCLPNSMNVSYANPSIAGLPLCDIFNTYGCDFYWNVNGTLYADTNSNCNFDFQEPVFSNVKLKLYKGNNLAGETFTNSSGQYSLLTDTGNFTLTVDTTIAPGPIGCPPGGSYNYIVADPDSQILDQDFALQCDPITDFGVWGSYTDEPWLTPGTIFPNYILVGTKSVKYGKHCLTGVGGIVQVIGGGGLQYSGILPGIPVPVVSGDTLTFNIPDFSILDYGTFGLNFEIPTNAAPGSTICLEMYVYPNIPDPDTTNNHYLSCFTIVGSFDPNDKSVNPKDVISDKDGWLNYTIRFQNTGTAPAQNIYVVDTLDQNLDVTSLELLAYSFEPLVQLNGNIAVFNFPDINLPDSTNDEPNSHGFFYYRIKLKDSLDLHTTISNTAYIYFDYNAPVQTNVVTDTLLDCNLVIDSYSISGTSFCKGDTIFASVSVTDSAVVNWYLDSVLVGTGPSIFVTNVNTGNYFLRAKATTYYCTKEISIPVSFHNLPTVNLGSDTTSCNTNVVLNAGAGFINYLWNNGATMQTMLAQSTGNYSVMVTDANGCKDFDFIHVTINPLPVVSLNAFNFDTVCMSQGIQIMNAGSPAGGTFSGNGVTGNQFDPNVTGVGLHYLNYQFTDSLGCSNSATDSIFVDLCLGIGLIDPTGDIFVYPNPATNSIFIKSQSNGDFDLVIFDVTGRELKRSRISGSNNMLQMVDVSELSAGNYLMKIFANNSISLVKQFVILKRR